MTLSVLNAAMQEAAPKAPALTPEEVNASIQQINEELEAITQAQMAQSELEDIMAMAPGQNPDLVVAAANGALLKIDPDLALEFPSMETIEENEELAMEGIGDFITKIKNFIANAWKGIGEKISKMAKNFTYAFKGIAESAEAVLEGLKKNGVKVKSVDLSKDNAIFCQIDGKQVNPFVAYMDVNQAGRDEYDAKNWEKIMALFDGINVKSASEFIKIAGKANEMYLSLTGQTKENGSKMKGFKVRNADLYSTTPLLATFEQYSVMSNFTMDDGKTKIIKFISQGWRYDAPSRKGLPTSMKAASQAEIEKALKGIMDTAPDVEKNWKIALKTEDRYDEIFEAAIDALSDVTMSSQTSQLIGGQLNSIAVAFILYSNYFYNYLAPCQNAIIAMAKAHTEL